jgi:hypothetical protein
MRLGRAYRGGRRMQWINAKNLDVPEANAGGVRRKCMSEGFVD